MNSLIKICLKAVRKKEMYKRKLHKKRRKRKATKTTTFGSMQKKKLRKLF